MFLSLRSGLSVISRGVIAGAQQSYNRILKLFPTVSSQAPASTRPVQQGQVCEFDGVNDYAELPEQALSHNQAWSIEVDFKFLATPTYRALYSEGNSATNTPSIYLGITGTHTQLDLYWRSDNNTVIMHEALFPVYSGNRHTVKVAFDGVDEVTVTKDGVITDTFTVTPLATTVDRATIGANGRADVSAFANAQISHVKTTQNGSTVGEYNLNHASGTTAYDSSGNGNHGTLQNGAAFVVDNTLPPEADKLNLEGFTNHHRQIRYANIDDVSVSHDLSFWINTTQNQFILFHEFWGASGGVGVLAFHSGSTAGAPDVYVDGVIISPKTRDELYNRVCDGENHFVEVNIGSNMTAGWGGIGFGYYNGWRMNTGVFWDVRMDDVPLLEIENIPSSSVNIPRDESDPTNDIFGNPLQYSGSVYPRRPEYRNSYAASFDGSNDRLECSTNALVRAGNVVEFKVKVDYQANQTTSIIANNHSSNSSTCFSPHMRLVHNSNQIRFYGCRGAPYPYWSIDSSFYGVWHTIKLSQKIGNGWYLSIDGGDEVSLASIITTPVGDWGSNRDTYWAFGTGKNMELSDVKIFTTESDYNLNNPIIHHPLTEGAGDTAHDISGNDNHGTINNASTTTEGAGFWAGRIDGEDNALNNNNGFSKRMLFDGVDDYVSVSPSSLDPSSDGQVITFNIVYTGSGNGKVYSYRTVGSSNFVQITVTSGNTMSLDVRGSGGVSKSDSLAITRGTLITGTLTFNGVAKTASLVTNQGTASVSGFDSVEPVADARIGCAYTGSNGFFFQGVIYNVNIASVSNYNGYGNTDADWTDQIGSNDGTVNGSPALLRIPADTSEPTKDVFGDTLTNPAVTDGYNDAETELDAYNIAEGDNPSPATNNNSDLDAIEFGTDFASNDAAYMRLKSSTENDRLITFEDGLTGDDKELVEKFTETP